MLILAGCESHGRARLGIKWLPGLDIRTGALIHDAALVSLDDGSFCAVWCVTTHAPSQPMPPLAERNNAYIGTFHSTDVWDRVRSLWVADEEYVRLMRTGESVVALSMPSCRLGKVTHSLTLDPVAMLRFPRPHTALALDVAPFLPDSVIVAYSAIIPADSNSTRHVIAIGTWSARTREIRLHEVASYPTGPRGPLFIRLRYWAGSPVIVANHATNGEGTGHTLLSAFVREPHGAWSATTLALARRDSLYGFDCVEADTTLRVFLHRNEGLEMFTLNSGGVWLSPQLCKPVNESRLRPGTMPAPPVAVRMEDGTIGVVWVIPSDHRWDITNVLQYLAFTQPTDVIRQHVAWSTVNRSGALDSVAIDLSKKSGLGAREDVSATAGSSTRDGAAFLIATHEYVGGKQGYVDRLRIAKYNP